jgi:AcrR family transcriptional regulator
VSAEPGQGSRDSRAKRDPVTVSALRLIGLAVAASAALVVLYLALGGSSYAPSAVQDPCDPRPWRDPSSVEEAAEQFTLSGLDGAACELHVSREALAVALASETSREQFAQSHGISDAEFEDAVRAGVIRAIDDAENAGALSPIVATPLRVAAANLPVDEAIALIQDASGVFEGAQGILGDASDALDQFLP